jgi:hypothetical protein
VAVLAVTPGAGVPTPVAAVPSGTHWPRHHWVHGSRLYVANQLGDEVNVLALGADGVPRAVVQRVAVGSPTAVVPAFL